MLLSTSDAADWFEGYDPSDEAGVIAFSGVRAVAGLTRVIRRLGMDRLNMPELAENLDVDLMHGRQE